MRRSIPRLSFSSRQVLAKASFGLGTVWGVAGAFKILFGVRLTLPLLPPLGLEHVAAFPALGAALGFFALGAVLGRVSTDLGSANEREPGLEEHRSAQLGASDVNQSMPSRRATPLPLRQTPR